MIVAQFKNEAESLPQWLDHYLTDEGVAAMLLIDDNSTDSWRQAVEPYGARVRKKTAYSSRKPILPSRMKRSDGSKLPYG